VFPGYHVPPFYDSLVAKLICWGRDRDEAVARTRRALGEFVVEGIRTTIPFHVELLADPRVQAGDYHVEFLEQRGAASGRIAT
jgi:acetyl-CoA carboxylase biotin carboxylase subunit